MGMVCNCMCTPWHTYNFQGVQNIVCLDCFEVEVASCCLWVFYDEFDIHRSAFLPIFNI